MTQTARLRLPRGAERLLEQAPPGRPCRADFVNSQLDPHRDYGIHDNYLEFRRNLMKMVGEIGIHHSSIPARPETL